MALGRRKMCPSGLFSIHLNSVCSLVQMDIWRDSTPHEIVRRSTTNGELTLENTISFYQTKLLIGTPPQPILVQVDTGSSDLWVISADNPYCAIGSMKCSLESAFVATNSQSFHPNTSSQFMISYGDSSFAEGFYVQDNVQIGGAVFKEHPKHSFSGFNALGHMNRGYWTSDPDQETEESDEESPINNEFRGEFHNEINSAVKDPPFFVIHKANFALATKSNSTVAVWGIGMDSTEAMARHVDEDGNVFPTYSNLPMQMKEQGHIESISYSLWLNDLNAASGSLLFGGVDHAKYQGQSKTVPMVSNNPNVSKPVDFSVMLHGIGVYNAGNEGADIVDCSISVVSDSGTTYTQLPRQIIQPIAETIGAFYDSTNGSYLLNETQRDVIKGSGLAFNLSGIRIKVDFDELLIPVGPLKKFQSRDGDNPNGDDATTHVNNAEMSNYFPTDGTDHRTVDDAAMLNEFQSTKARKRPSNYWLLGLYPSEFSKGTEYILGDTFLRSAYVVYDLERKEIASANTNYNVTDTDIEVIGERGVPSAEQAVMYSSTSIVDTIVVHHVNSIFTSDGTATSTVSAGDPSSPSTQVIATATGITQTLEANYDLCNSQNSNTQRCYKHPSHTHISTTHHHGMNRNAAVTMRIPWTQWFAVMSIYISLYVL